MTENEENSMRQFISPFLWPDSHKLVVILLNNRLPLASTVFWDKAHYRICADGAANQLCHIGSSGDGSSGSQIGKSLLKRPDLITGDMDSIRPDVYNYYKASGCRIDELVEDQDTTDLQKCVCSARNWLKERGSNEGLILGLGAFGGRLDHTLSNLNSLYMNPDLDIVLCGDGSLARLLPEGKSQVSVSNQEGPHCGVVPLGKPAHITSKGLKWDMDNLEVKVGGLLSTSNRMTADRISITTDSPVIWMTEFNE